MSALGGITDSIDFNQVKRVLLIKLRNHGDVLLTSPVFATLKSAYPHLEIDALVYKETAPMLEGLPSMAQLHVIDKNWKKRGLWARLRAEYQLLSNLRRRQYEVVLHLTNHSRGGWLAHFLRPQYAITYRCPKKGWLWHKGFSHFAHEVAFRHTVDRHLDALRRVGFYPPSSHTPLQLEVNPIALTHIKAQLQQHQLAEKQFIVVHPGSRWLFKCWPETQVSALINQLCARGERLIITGAPDPVEMEMLTRVLAGVSHPVLSWAGELTLQELAAVISCAKALIGVDSVPMHMAAALQIPVVALFGPSSEVKWGPWQVKHKVVSSTDYACRPCDVDGCGGGRVSECLRAVSVGQVLQSLDEVLRE